MGKLFGKSNSILGIDIGTSNIKIAQVTHGPTAVLDTYGIVNMTYQLGGKNDELVIRQMAQVLKSLMQRANVTAKRCIISFPNSTVFSSVIQLPQMSDQELGSAVEFEAKKYVPLALSEVDLSWEVIGPAAPGGGSQKILLTAAPKHIVNNYKTMLSLAGISSEAGEIEALALIRSLIGEVHSNCVIIDIGARSTGLNIIENGYLRLSRNLNIGGDTITDKIAQSLNISFSRAEQFKKDFGVSSPTFIPDTIKPVLNIVKNEVKQLLTIYQSQGVAVDKILLVGGGANLPGIEGYFGDLGVKVELGDPLKSVAYDSALAPVLKRYSLSLPIAIGLALRNE
ncbi:MAG TPA: type IV pilus assembly protein PilM [Patescibacteria group bacterium]|nr:type IV pilus assembly protein PilM [Patescibacteria group bacterium]